MLETKCVDYKFNILVASNLAILVTNIHYQLFYITAKNQPSKDLSIRAIILDFMFFMTPYLLV